MTRNSVVTAAYSYNGVGSLVGTELPEPQVWIHRFDLLGSAGNMDHVDRFGRVKRDVWTLGIDTSFPADGTFDEYLNYYDVNLSYDRNSNITLVKDNRFEDPNGTDYDNQWDALYSMDALNRLVGAERGQYDTGSITATSFEQLWTLSQTGNWERHTLDIGGTTVLDDTQTFNVANELLTRDIDSNSSVDFTLSYDALGNLVDDDQYHKYVYDAFGRLRQVLNQTSDLVAEYRYNGVGHRISWHYDVNTDGDVDSDDPIYHFVHDERWRPLATYRHDHSDFDDNDKSKERFDYHNAGVAGLGGSSYIDRVLLRDRDITNGWDGAGDGTLEERAYLLQNWRADVIAVIAPNGGPQMYYRYDAYGVPTAIHPADINADGVVDFTDFQLLDDMMDSFDQRGDFADDFGFSGPDGIVDFGDFAYMLGVIGTYGRGFVADADAEYGGLRKLYAGYEFDPSLAGFKYHVRNRVYDAEQGRWTRRDPLGYVDGMGLYKYVRGRAVLATDPMGLAMARGIGGGIGSGCVINVPGGGVVVPMAMSMSGCGGGDDWSPWAPGPWPDCPPGWGKSRYSGLCVPLNPTITPAPPRDSDQDGPTDDPFTEVCRGACSAGGIYYGAVACYNGSPVICNCVERRLPGGTNTGYGSHLSNCINSCEPIHLSSFRCPKEGYAPIWEGGISKNCSECAVNRCVSDCMSRYNCDDEPNINLQGRCDITKRITTLNADAWCKKCDAEGEPVP